MAADDYNDIPGTTVFDAAKCRMGYHLIKLAFCDSLSVQKLAASMTGVTAEQYAQISRARDGRCAGHGQVERSGVGPDLRGL